MTSHLRRVALTFLLLTGLSSAALVAQDEEEHGKFWIAGTNAQEVDQFALKLRRALKRNDRVAVARMFRYPVTVWDGRRYVRLRRAQHLLGRFDMVFDRGLRRTIQNANSENAFANYQGVMWDRGRIWISPVDGRGLRIIRVNSPM